MAGTTGLEPAASAVTGQRSNQLNYVPTRQVNKMRNRPVFMRLWTICIPCRDCRGLRQTTLLLAELRPNHHKVQRRLLSRFVTIRTGSQEDNNKPDQNILAASLSVRKCAL